MTGANHFFDWRCFFLRHVKLMSSRTLGLKSRPTIPAKNHKRSGVICWLPGSSKDTAMLSWLAHLNMYNIASFRQGYHCPAASQHHATKPAQDSATSSTQCLVHANYKCLQVNQTLVHRSLSHTWNRLLLQNLHLLCLRVCLRAIPTRTQ